MYGSVANWRGHRGAELIWGWYFLRIFWTHLKQCERLLRLIQLLSVWQGQGTADFHPPKITPPYSELHPSVQICVNFANKMTFTASESLSYYKNLVKRYCETIPPASHPLLQSSPTAKCFYNYCMNHRKLYVIESDSVRPEISLPFGSLNWQMVLQISTQPFVNCVH